MVIKLDLDDADFGRGVANSKKQVSYLAKEMQANMKISDLAGNKLGKLGSKYQGLTGIISAQEKQVASLKKAYDGSFVDGKATDSTKRLAAQLQDANGKLANYKQQLILTSGAIAEYQVKNEGFTGAVNKVSESMVRQGKVMENAGAALTKGVTLPIAAGVATVTAAAISWESAFTGVLKTNDEVVDSTGKVVYSYQDLENGLRGLAKELPSSHQEIAATAEAAGQLGIQTDNVVAFTKTMIDLGESTNMSAETAATELARFANITQMSQNDFGRLGSVLVELGNNFATTEGEISAMALRLAGAGSQIGMSEAEIMGFAAALSSVGIEAEAGGSAFSKVMVQMQLATEKGAGAFDELESLANNAGYTLKDVAVAVQDGGKNLKAFAGELGTNSTNLKAMYKEADKSATSLQNFSQVAGMTNMEFATLFKDDPSKAIMKFVEGLSKAEEQGTSAIKVLDDMDITEVRLRDSLLRAANASGVFEGAIQSGTKAWEQNSALTEEAGKRYETTESKLKMLKNEAMDAAIELGGPFVDALRDALSAGKPLIESLGKMAKAFSEADPQTQKMILGLLGTAAAAGPVMSIAGKTAGTIGKLGGSFVELSAKMAKKKAIEEAAEALLTGNVSAGDFLKTLSGGKSTLANFGGAASTAAGAKGIGAMSAALGPLGPAILGIVGVGGALAVGYGAWKLFGEEAWNSAQRTKRWGSDVGAATDDALTKVSGFSQSAIGEFNLMEQGLAGNTEAISGNFASMGQSIETNLVNKISLLKEMLNNLPEDVRAAGEKVTQEEISNQEKQLNTVQENNAAIAKIREEASKNNRKLTYEDTVRIKALAEESATAYVQSLGKSEKETKQILSAMTGNVSEASKEQATGWLQSLGKQRQGSKIEYGKMKEDLENDLVKAGYDLNSSYAKEMLGLLETSSQSATQLTEDQMGLILAKYPELANEVFLANGQLISSMGDASHAAVNQNKKMMESFGNFSRQAAQVAEENKEKIKLVLDESNKFGEFWNGLVLDPKTGELKTNAQEEVNKAAESEKGWNQLMWISKDANVSSNVKMMIAEAAISNGKWESMSYTEQQALLDSNVTQTMTQALQVNGSWEKLNFEQKKAIIYSNTPEIMAETLLNLGLWNDYQTEIKDLKAENYNFLNTLSQSEEKMNHWNSVPETVKKFQGENYDLLNKIYSSEENFNRWKSIPDETKIMLAENADLLMKLSSSKSSLESWNQLPASDKLLLADNTDLANKVFASQESLNIWNSLPNPIKHFVGNNENLIQKIQEGELAQETFDANLPALKQLLGDASSVINESRTGEQFLNNYKNNNPVEKKLRGDSSSTQGAARTGEQFLNNYRGNNPAEKYLRGNSSGVQGAATSGGGALNVYARNNPRTKSLNATDNASGPAGNATRAVQNFGNQGDKKVTLTTVVKTVTQWITEKLTKNATGTQFHPGGHMMVNDQKGPLYRELVVEPDGTAYIPDGRDVIIPNAKRGTKVFTARETKQMIPRYAKGTRGNAVTQYQKQNTERLLNLKVDFNTGKITADQYRKSLNNLSKTAKLTGAQLRTIKTELNRINSVSKKTIDQTQKLNSNLTNANNKYLKAVQKINSDLIKDTKEAQKKYQEHLAQTEKSIYSQIGLFNRAQTKLFDKNYLKDNLKSQVDQLKDWNKDINKLSKVAPKKFVDELREMGVDNAGEIKALTQMSKKELNAYINLWNQKHSLSKKEAVIQSQPEKVEMQNEIASLNKEATKELNKAKSEWKTELNKYKATAKELSSFKNNGANIGRNVADGLINGLKGMQGPLSKQSKAMANSVIKDMKKTLGIHSPSRVAETQIGAMLPAGVAQGIERNKQMAFGALDGMVQQLQMKVPRDQTIRMLETVNQQANTNEQVILNGRNYEEKFNQLISIMENFGADLKNLQVQAIVDGKSFNKQNAPYQSAQSVRRNRRSERGIALDVQL